MKLNKGYGSYTHQPLIKGVLDLYEPEFILELGIGVYSTPIFLGRINNCPGKEVGYFGIENNAEWIAYIEKKYDTPTLFKHHDLDDIKIGDSITDLRYNQIRDITKYYKALKFSNKRPNLLFIDNYASCRAIAFNALRHGFDMIILHDCEPHAVGWYCWDILQVKEFEIYYLTSYESWTGLFIRPDNDKGYKTLKSSVDSYIKELEVRDGDLNMHLIKNDNHI